MGRIKGGGPDGYVDPGEAPETQGVFGATRSWRKPGINGQTPDKALFRVRHSID